MTEIGRLSAETSLSCVYVCLSFSVCFQIAIAACVMLTAVPIWILGWSEFWNKGLLLGVNCSVQQSLFGFWDEASFGMIQIATAACDVHQSLFGFWDESSFGTKNSYLVSIVLYSSPYFGFGMMRVLERSTWLARKRDLMFWNSKTSHISLCCIVASKHLGSSPGEKRRASSSLGVWLNCIVTGDYLQVLLILTRLFSV